MQRVIAPAFITGVLEAVKVGSRIQINEPPSCSTPFQRDENMFNICNGQYIEANFDEYNNLYYMFNFGNGERRNYPRGQREVLDMVEDLSHFQILPGTQSENKGACFAEDMFSHVIGPFDCEEKHDDRGNSYMEQLFSGKKWYFAPDHDCHESHDNTDCEPIVRHEDCLSEMEAEGIQGGTHCETWVNVHPCTGKEFDCYTDVIVNGVQSHGECEEIQKRVESMQDW